MNKDYPMDDEQRHKSDAFAAIHETMDALHQTGAINKQTMREFDDACLTPIQKLGLHANKGTKPTTGIE